MSTGIGAVDETAFEAQLMANRTAMMVFYYWILKLKTRLLSGDYVEALAAADKAKALLWISAAHIQLLDYFYYTALTVAAVPNTNRISMKENAATIAYC